MSFNGASCYLPIVCPGKKVHSRHRLEVWKLSILQDLLNVSAAGLFGPLALKRTSYNMETGIGLSIDASALFFRTDIIHYYWSWGSTLVLKKVIQHCPCATHVRPRTAATLQPPTTPPPSPFYSRAEATTTSPHQTKRGPTSPCCPPQAPLLLQIVNNNTHYIQPCYYCGPRQLVFLLLVFTRFQHSTFDSGLGPDFWGQ